MLPLRSVILIVGALSCHVSQGSPASVQPHTPSTQSIELAGQLDLARLLDLAAKQLNISIDYDAASMKQQTVTIRPTGSIDPRGLWALTNRSLHQRQLTTVQIADMPGVSVVKLEDASKLARIEEPVDLAAIDTSRPWTPTAGFRNFMVRLSFVSPKEAAESLKSVIGRGGDARAIASITPVAGDSQLLLISDVASRVDEAIAILRRIDVAERATAINEVQLTHVTPAQVVTTVTQLAAKRELVSGEKLVGEVIAAPGNGSVLLIAPTRLVPIWKSLIAQADDRDPVETIAYTPRVFAVRDVANLVQQIAPGTAASPDDRFKAVVEEPTGTLLVTGTGAQHERIRDLMERLDSVPGEARRPMRAFSVRNRPVDELLEVLNRLIAAGALNADPASTGTSVSGLSPIPLPVTTSTNPGLGVNIISPVASSPLLPGPQQSFARPSPSMLAAGSQNAGLTLTADQATNTIIAIGETRMLSQLEALLRTLDVRQPQVVLEVILVTLSERDSISIGVELQKLIRDGNTAISLSSLFGLSTVTGTGVTQALSPAAASGFTGAVVRPGDYSAIIRALQSLGDGRTVSLPRVLVANNQRTQFDSLAQEPYGVSFTQGNSNATNVTFGGTLDAGTRLSIKPQIGEGDSLLLDYSISVSSFGEQGSGNLPPSRQVTSVQSLATVPDGHTVVVGGLETSTDSRSTDQLPLISDIPVLGEAFKNRSRNRTRSRFFVMIRASIIRGQSFETLRYLSEDAIRQAGIDDKWPKSTPQVIK